jgi:CRP/FNR family transcriptional regulator, cyclic AMP receptor protein
VNVLVARSSQPNNLVRLLPARAFAKVEQASRASGALHERDPVWPLLSELNVGLEQWCNPIRATTPHAEARDPLYLFACQLEWEQKAEPTAAWEVISAARSSHADTRAHARALLERTLQAKPRIPDDVPVRQHSQNPVTEVRMRTPYGLEMIESCMGCKASREGFFCRFSQDVTRAMDAVSHHTIMPAGAMLFVEGQKPRGLFVLCSGRVKLTTTSKDGKMLILKQAEAGEALGLSATISNTNYEMNAETSTPCQLNFIGRQDFMKLLETEGEVGTKSAVWLSRDFQGAYRDIHDLVLARSSSGRLARLLLSCAHPDLRHSDELHLRSTMTHEEMAQRIGSSRETVTRLLSDLKKKRLIRLEGATLVIRDRNGLEALAV